MKRRTKYLYGLAWLLSLVGLSSYATLEWAKPGSAMFYQNLVLMILLAITLIVYVVAWQVVKKSRGDF